MVAALDPRDQRPVKSGAPRHGKAPEYRVNTVVLETVGTIFVLVGFLLIGRVAAWFEAMLFLVGIGLFVDAAARNIVSVEQQRTRDKERTAKHTKEKTKNGRTTREDPKQ